jgi:hypothetical protein
MARKFTKTEIKAMPVARVRIGYVRLKQPVEMKLYRCAEWVYRWPHDPVLHNTVKEDAFERLGWIS